MEFLEIAALACKQGHVSPFLTSSENDMAHKIGLYCLQNEIFITHLKKNRGYKWTLNNKYILDFKNDSFNPTVVEL